MLFANLMAAAWSSGLQFSFKQQAVFSRKTPDEQIHAISMPEQPAI